MAVPTISAWYITPFGVGVILAGLVCLIAIIRVAAKRKRGETGHENSEAPAAGSSAGLPAVSGPVSIADRPRFIAAVAAAIAQEMGTEPGGLRIHSIRQVGEVSAGRGEFVAAVSVAIAQEMGTEPSGLRIHSIRTVDDGRRGEFVAAISVAIAESMGVDIGGLRIHSIRQASVGNGGRGELIAAISAAIATGIGADINGIRIHSMKQV